MKPLLFGWTQRDPLYAKGVVVIGAQGGEWPYRGPIFGIDAATGQKKWEFLTVGGTDEALKTWGNGLLQSDPSF
jgi:outer membrane protein assembly factor BamB